MSYASCDLFVQAKPKLVLDRIGLLAVHPTNMQKHPIRFEVISMNRRRILAGAFLALALLVGCASPPPVQSPESGGDASSANASLPTVSTPGVNTALPDSDFSFSSVESAPEFTLNESLLSLLNSDNATLRQIRDERCYAELTLRGTLRLTYFSPILPSSLRRRQIHPTVGWKEAAPDFTKKTLWRIVSRSSRSTSVKSSTPKRPPSSDR